MGQIISVIRRCLPLCFPLPESEDQNEASHVVGVEDQNEDVQSNSTTSSMADLTFSSSSDLTLPSSSESRWDYDVFLSFRGEDTRKNFTNHLYSTLDQVGIRTFRDDEELPRGENISTELVNAIRGSRIFIVIFSKGYASSRWCLDELVEIMKCKETIGHTLLPIFYHVDPSDVRKQTGTFREALAKHEEQFQTDMGRVRGWRVALTEAANCSGLDLESVANGYESTFIKVIVEDVLHKVNPAHLPVAEHPIGMKSRVDHIKHLLNLRTNDVRIVGIYGIGGIGKTTLAKAVYNEICDTFTGSSFLSNVKEISQESIGLVHLQKQLLDDILHKKNWNVYNADGGINMIKERIQGKKVLVVVDDVDHVTQLHTLVGNFKLFGWGSRVIVTTRDEQLLTQLEVDGKYKVGELSSWESFQLFKWHAFKMTHPIKEHLKLSVSVVKYTGGLPLALVVLGSSLFGKSVDEWTSKLKKLQKIPNREIQKVLKISFDSLDDETMKDIFLDIACFFIGMEKEYVIKILDACDFFAKDGLSILIQRSLVTIDDHNKLTMHDLIRDMGRGIVLAESPSNPGKRSRLWFHEDVLNVLSKHTGSEIVEGLILNLPILEDVHLKTEAFTNMKNLRLLQINSVNLTGSYEHLFEKLKWLCWQKCPLKYLPKNFQIMDLLILDMQHSKVKQVWKTKEIFNKLKVLNLSNSVYLTTLPDFSQVPQLEILILEGCTNLKYLPNFLESSHFENLNLEGCTSLIEIHESIGLLKRLVLLNLRGCKNLRNLSPSISKIKSLKTLVLSECFNLMKVPKQLGSMTALTKLYLEKTAIKELPSSFSLSENLEVLSLRGCECLIRTPKFSQTSRLHRLNLKDCTSLVEIHESIGFLKGLYSLDLDGCQVLKNLPSSMSNLEIETLSLCGCSKLQKLPEEFGHKTALLKLQRLSLDECTTLQSISLPASVYELRANGCTSLETILISDKGTFGHYMLNNCYKLVKIHSLKGFKTGLVVRMGGCISLADDFSYSIFLSLSYGMVYSPGSEIPNWIIHQTIGSSVSLRVPPSLDGKICGLLLFVVFAPTPAYMKGLNNDCSFIWSLYKNGQLFHKEYSWTIRDISEDHIYAERHLHTFKLKSGDEIQLSAEFEIPLFERKPFDQVKPFEVKKCGIHFLVDVPAYFLVDEPNVRDEDESDFDTCTDDDEF